VLAETFDRGWSVRVADSSGTPAEAHFLANGYANGWIVERTGDFQLVVEYSPHRYAVAGAAVTSAALVGAGLVLLAAALRRRGWA
jgi:hypothetical protein